MIYPIRETGNTSVVPTVPGWREDVNGWSEVGTDEGRKPRVCCYWGRRKSLAGRVLWSADHLGRREVHSAHLAASESPRPGRRDSAPGVFPSVSRPRQPSQSALYPVDNDRLSSPYVQTVTSIDLALRESGSLMFKSVVC